ncbi:hypothetical protein PENSPDRAFT_639129 [Peniophora sp. CONT]|nr:hypothetical protein PENSPDRAFT_639129 [Peniophora sp. CONT]
MSEKRVTVMMYGPHADALVPVTHEQVHLRKKDHTRFVFELRRYDGDSKEIVDFALAVIDASHEVEDSELSADLQLVQQSNSRMAYIMFSDAPASIEDDSESYLWYLVRRARLSARYNLDCLPVDADLNSGGLTHLLGVLADIAYPLAKHSSWTTTWTHVQDEILDVFARCLSLPCTHSVPDVLDELSTIKSDDHLLELANSTLSKSWEDEIKASLPEDIRNVSYFPTHRISPSLIAKYPTISERESMDFVRQHTTIPVPRTHLPNLKWLVMDRIDGETLLSCWNKLSWFKQLRVACTLRLYVKQLRALRRSYPGNVHGRVSGLFFQDNVSSKREFGPYDDADALRRFCTYVAFTGWDSRIHLDEDELEPPPNSNFDWSPVFVHGDLNVSNIILDRRDTVWLIDWAWAGYYPPCIESLAMRHSNVYALEDIVPTSWTHYRTFIAGPTTGGLEKFWYHVLASIHRF